MKYSFTTDKRTNVLEFLADSVGGVSVGSLKKLLKQREIKVNGERVSENRSVEAGDRIEIFVPSAFINDELCIVYEDDSVLIINKPAHISVTGGLSQILLAKYTFAVPVHRLDANTAGLVVFAKNSLAEKLLIDAFKLRSIQKKYRALVMGTPKEGTHKAYLFKDEKNSTVFISDSAKAGYKEIVTGVRLIKAYPITSDDTISRHNSSVEKSDSVSEVELTLVTGRTHQLRAHLSHLGHPIIGDDKYGDYALNKRARVHTQQLIATSLHFPNLGAPLQGISERTLSIPHTFNQPLKNISD